MSHDPWNGHNPEDDPIFLEKVAKYRAEQKPLEEAEELRMREVWRERYLAHTINLSTGESTDKDEYLCVICCRSFTEGRGKFKWIACKTCLAFDRAAARVLGSKQLIPLGLHSIMNGAFIDTSANPTLQLAQKDRLLAHVSNYGILYNHRSAVLKEMAQEIGWADRETVPWGDWVNMFPASFAHSEEAYLDLIDEKYDWAYALLPQLEQHGWLAKQARKLVAA